MMIMMMMMVMAMVFGFELTLEVIITKSGKTTLSLKLNKT